ncbi:cytochrome P450 [Streptomyces sp. NBC_01304]|uniref:cytochrome P450 n=1 Tax=Streptomyces sp. NBC_01304 TaxID=2903818 RepID=UPI002E1382E4|nr:cytochrome P450 [Streptomyces sp. NBC_01304]
MNAVAEIDVTSDSLYYEDHPWAELATLRRESPVHWYQQPGYEPFWLISRHEDIAWVSRNTEFFSHQQRIGVETPDEIDPWEIERERRAGLYGHPADYPVGLGLMDAPLHTQVRAAMYPCFTTKASEARSERLAELSKGYVADFLKTLDERGTADVAYELSALLPLAVIFELLGIPEEDWDELFEYHKDTATAFHTDFATADGQQAMQRFMRAMGALDEYFSALVRRRMEEGGEGGTDVLSRLVQATVDEQPLAFHDMSYMLFNLVQAGNGTTRNVIAGGIRALLQHPDQLQKLIDDPSLLDSAVDEIIRYTSIAVTLVRTCVKDTEIGGQKIRKGETVALFYPSGNRDEDAFSDPNAFDITRKPNRHVSFGGNGMHRCVGAALAREEIKAMFKVLVPVLPTLELDGEVRQLVLRMVILEYAKLPVRRKEK